MLNKLERKLGKYAIPHLIVYVLAAYGIGVILQMMYRMTGVNIISYMTLDPYYIIHHAQIWRLFTWVMVSSQESFLLALIMMFFYYQLGTALEQTWGTFRFNVYIFSGLLFTIIGAFAVYGLFYLLYGASVPGIGGYITTYYLEMSIFFAFSVCYPNMQVRLYFLFPIRMKVMSIVYFAFIGFDVLSTFLNAGAAVGLVKLTVVLSSLLSFFIFYMMNRKYQGGATYKSKPSRAQRKRANEFKKSYESGAFRSTARNDGMGSSTSTSSRGNASNITRHKCAICGRSERDGAGLEFRFCSKCNGNYEYCQEHLFTHKHIV